MSRSFNPVSVYIALILAVLFFCFDGTAADTAPGSIWLARTWDSEDGLPDNNVTGVEQSRDGYLWVSTLGGLMRFNGSRFEEFSLLHIPEVANRVVRKMFMDHAGRFWLVMDRGSIIRVDKSSTKVFTQSDGLQYTRVTAMAEDHDGAIWLACGSSLYRILDDKVTHYGSEDGLPEGNTTWVSSDTDGRLWFSRGNHVGICQQGQWKNLVTVEQSPVRLTRANNGGLWICSGSQILRYQPGKAATVADQLPEKVIVSAMLEDREGALWITTEADGVFHLQGKTIDRVSTSHPEISCITEDREGNLWVGTGGGGLNLLRSQVLHLLGKKDGLPGESVRSVCQSSEGQLWIAMNNGLLAHGRGDEWKEVSSSDGWLGGNATAVAADTNGGVWIGTRDRGLQYLREGKTTEFGRRQGLESTWIRSLLISSNGDLWIASGRPNQLIRHHEGKFDAVEMPGEVRSLRALAEGADGTIWAGSSDGQLLRLQDHKLVNIKSTRDERPLSIRALHATADGSLWIGYAGWGIGRWSNGQLARVTTKEGLHDDYVSQILSDNKGGLWLNSNHGLFQVRQDELIAMMEGRVQRVRSIVCGKNEGLPSIQATWDNSPSVCRASNGQLWFATRNGLLAAQPDRIEDNPSPPPVMLERVSLDDKIVALQDARSPLRGHGYTNSLDLTEPGAVMTLPPGHRKLEFEFAALSFGSPENVHFRYRLKNFDNEWIEADALHVAKYPQLPAGKYEFEVRACNNAGSWSEEGVRLNLEVSPFIWQRWWFRALVVLLFTASIVGLARYFSFRKLRLKLDRLEQQAALQRERTRIARDMHDDVGSKLSRLSLLSEMVSNQTSMSDSLRGEVSEISETARDTIRSFEEIVWAVNPKNDSLANLMNYLCRFAEDFFEGSGTQCVFDVPYELPDIELPTGARRNLFLTAKEALNNVFKHAKASRVCVRLRLTREGFEIEIEDDGTTFDTNNIPESRAGSGNGLENMRERMKQLGGEFEIKANPKTGTRVSLRLGCNPLRTN